MNKYLVFNEREVQKTDYDYTIGETIKVNSNQTHMCIDILEVEDNIYYMFNEGVPIYKYKEISLEDKSRFTERIKREINS